MTRVALACFEEQADGSWICRQDITIDGSRGYRFSIKRGQRFLQHTTFAGYDDFTGYLASGANSGPVSLHINGRAITGTPRYGLRSSSGALPRCCSTERLDPSFRGRVRRRRRLRGRYTLRPTTASPGRVGHCDRAANAEGEHERNFIISKTCQAAPASLGADGRLAARAHRSRSAAALQKTIAANPWRSFGRGQLIA